MVWCCLHIRSGSEGGGGGGLFMMNLVFFPNVFQNKSPFLNSPPKITCICKILSKSN